jgi:hypothetical protein
MILNTEINKTIEYLDKINKTTRWVNGREMSVAELAKIRSNKDGKDGYGNKHDFKLILADTCLAWQNRYKKVVIPRLLSISKRYRHIKTLEELKELISNLGDRFGSEFLDFNAERRVKMFTDLVDAFIDYKNKLSIADDLEAMKHWARHSKAKYYKAGINGWEVDYLGIANFQYLRMLCGVDAIKPDSHILKGIIEALGYPKKPLEAIKLIEEVSQHTGTKMLEIDQTLWVYFADEIPDIEWKNDIGPGMGTPINKDP